MDDFSTVSRQEFISSQLKVSFNGVERVDQNYSQALQDIFVLTMLNGKENGTYVEIGGAHPININNTYLLESVFNWSGVSFEINTDLANFYNNERSNKCICTDATQVNYSKVFEENNLSNQIDYLQVDIDPSYQSLAALKKIDLKNYRFSVITFETDVYQGSTAVLEQSRNILQGNGYQLVASNVKNCGHAFEDWYVDPNTVTEDIWSTLQSDNMESTQILHS
tara:strand:- start:13990 stop:14658 length:669 start_codon:yes stop_codon:yes gene_type:complete